MTNEEAIEVFDLMKTTIRNQPSYFYEALGVAYEALKKSYRFDHVIIHHPKYGDCDGWLDRERMLLLCVSITCEQATQFGWTWRVE